MEKANQHIPAAEKAKQLLNGQKEALEPYLPSKQLPQIMTKSGSAFLKKYICSKANEKDLTEIQIQLLARKYAFQDILNGKVHILPYWDKDLNTYRYQVVASIHEMMAKADATGLLDGVLDESDATEEKSPTWAQTTVWKKGCTHPFVTKVWYREYARKTREGKLFSMWAEKGDVMLKKCSRATALRLAFAAVLMDHILAEELGIEEPAPVVIQEYDVSQEQQEEVFVNGEQIEEESLESVEQKVKPENGDAKRKVAFLREAESLINEISLAKGEQFSTDKIGSLGYENIDQVPINDFARVIKELKSLIA
jgi:hypothetical protein